MKLRVAAHRGLTLLLAMALGLSLILSSKADTIPMMTGATAQPQQKPLFTPQEQAWIAQHPVLRIGVDPHMRPLEYVEKNRYLGLTADFLAAVSNASGLRFEVTPLANDALGDALSDHQIDLLASVSRNFTLPSIRDQLLISTPYFVGVTIIVTRASDEIVFDPRKLNGKLVALKGGGMLEQILRQRYPAIKMLTFNTPDEALAVVADGTAAAAIGIESVLLPIMYRQYRDLLHVSGTVAETPAVLSIGVRRDLPELAGIVEKSLSTVTARQSDEITARWIEHSSYTTPSWTQILRYRTFESVLIAGTLILLLLAALYAWRARRAAEKSAQDKARFLAVMSHEIRTPMNAILASVELLARSRLTPQQRQLSDLAITASEALLELLDDVLDLSKLEARQLILTRSTTDIRQLAHGVVDMAALLAKQKNLEVRLLLDVQPATALFVDAARIRQILINLLSNAVKFTEHGQVQLHIALETPAPAPASTSTSGAATIAPAVHASDTTPAPEAGALQQNTHGAPTAAATLLLAVSDTGIGVPVEEQKKLFRPYVQVQRQAQHQAQRQTQRTGNRRFGGTGLGLTICRELCELMGGSIEFSSIVGVGTTVTCRIPVDLLPLAGSILRDADLTADRATSFGAVATPMAGRDGQSAGILVVEDHPGNRLVIQQQLAQLGYDCTIVADGRSALEQTAHTVFSLMLLDCQLPDIDGYTVAATQRAREAEQAGQMGNHHLPIIAISAAVDQAHLDACLRSGMDGTLRKPLRLDALGALLNAWCGPPARLPPAQPLPLLPDQPDTVLDALFMSSAREDVAALQAAFTLHNVEHAARTVHRLRGAALICGYPEIVALTNAIEQALKNDKNEARIDSVITPLIAKLQQIMSATADSQN